MELKPIPQEEALGCSVACVASLLGVSYKKSKKILGKNYNNKKGAYCKGIVKTLNKKGLNYKYGKVTEKTKKYLETPGTIIFIKRSENYPVGHYLLKTEKGFMDPWINYPEMNPVKAGFKKTLLGTPQWIIYQS